MDGVERELLRCLLAAFPDRVARRRRRGERDLVLASGGVARLSEQSVVVDPEFLLALDVEEQRGASSSQTTVRLASAIEPDWLLGGFRERGQAQRRARVERERRARRTRREDGVRRGRVRRSARRGAALAGGQRGAGSGRAPRFVAVVRQERRGLFADLAPAPAARALPGARTSRSSTKARSMRRSTLICVGFDQLRRAGRGRRAERAALRAERCATTRARERDPGARALAGRAHRSSPLRSRSPALDRIASAGLLRHARRSAAVPRQVPLTLHLLAPNQRAMQVTTDLSGFWERHYPSIRRELMRRYPRHPWPEDGRTATPPEPRPPRRR